MVSPSPRRLPEKPVRAGLYLYQRHIDLAKQMNINLSQLVRDLLDQALGPSPHLQKMLRVRTELETMKQEVPDPQFTAERFDQTYLDIQGDIVRLKVTHPDLDEYLLSRKLLEREHRFRKVKMDLAYFSNGYDHWMQAQGPGNLVHEAPSIDVQGPSPF